MKLTLRALNRATLARQLLLGRAPLDVLAGVGRIVAMQAQEPASPYLALWNRLDGFSPAELDDAFASYAVVKATSMRLTLHASIEAEYPAFREAVEPSLRAARLGDRRFAASGLTPADADALVPELLEFVSSPRQASECASWLAERLGGELHPGAWWGLRHYTPLLRAPTGGPWSFEQKVAYVAPRITPILANPEVSSNALQALVVRYLEGFGPASAADIAQFALVQRTRSKKALTSVVDGLERLEGPNGEQLFDIPGGLRPDEGTPAPPRLMAMWDSILLAYLDRSRVIPEEYRRIVIRNNGDVLPTLLVDGFVAGVWRATAGGIEATAFRELSDEVWDGLAEEAGSLLAFLSDREKSVYRRFDHWWRKLPAGQTRLLPCEGVD